MIREALRPVGTIDDAGFEVAGFEVAGFEVVGITPSATSSSDISSKFHLDALRANKMQKDACITVDEWSFNISFVTGIKWYNPSVKTIISIIALQCCHILPPITSLLIPQIRPVSRPVSFSSEVR